LVMTSHWIIKPLLCNDMGKTVRIDLGTERREERDVTYMQGSWVPYVLPAECLAIN